MIEITKHFWLNAGDGMPSLEGIPLYDHNLVYNISDLGCDGDAMEDSIKTIRAIRCGFEFRAPKINIFFKINQFTDEIATRISQMDTLLPRISVNLVIDDESIGMDSIVSQAHRKQDIAQKNKLQINFYFVIYKDYRLLGLAIKKLFQVRAISSTHLDNLATDVSVALELSPTVINKENDSFFEDTHFEVDNIIDVLSSCDYFNMDVPNTVCGLINMLRQIALCKGISEKLFTLSKEDIRFTHSEYSCFYNKVYGESLNCEECRNKLIRNIPLNLGVFDDSVKKYLSDNGEDNDFKVLISDWDYIV